MTKETKDTKSITNRVKGVIYMQIKLFWNKEISKEFLKNRAKERKEKKTARYVKAIEIL